ncbi:MAG: TonB-dependent receptor, partial [Hyphomonadaceae bacterium]|nr:TonB-dependent receptor [Hyphomonadaceae bacterium]
ESYTANNLNPATTEFQLDVPDYILHNASVRYLGDDWGATLGMRNIADEEPPRISTGLLNLVGNAPLYSGYDYRGREIFLNLTKNF